MYIKDRGIKKSKKKISASGVSASSLSNIICNFHFLLDTSCFLRFIGCENYIYFLSVIIHVIELNLPNVHFTRKLVFLLGKKSSPWWHPLVWPCFPSPACSHSRGQRWVWWQHTDGGEGPSCRHTDGTYFKTYLSETFFIPLVLKVKQRTEDSSLFAHWETHIFPPYLCIPGMSLSVICFPGITWRPQYRLYYGINPRPNKQVDRTRSFSWLPLS